MKTRKKLLYLQKKLKGGHPYTYKRFKINNDISNRDLIES